MATYFYGSTVSHWRAYGSYTTSESDTAVSVTLAGGFQSISWGFDINHVACTVYIGSSSKSVSEQSVETSSGSTTRVQLTSLTKSITKTTSSQSVTLKAKTVSSSSYYPGTSTASTTITVPALASYTVSYSANGGSGAPSSQTKWYGKTLTLSTTKPTRSGYSFLGWSTSSSATSATYSAGGSYTANASATLYAVWECDIVAPTISSYKAYRCDSDGTADDEGTYAYISFKWSCDTGYLSSNTLEKVKLQLYETGSSSATSSKTVTADESDASGTWSYTWAASLDAATAYRLKATITDSNGSTATKTKAIGVSAYIIDVDSGGGGIGLLTGAPESGVSVGGAVTATHSGIAFAQTHSTSGYSIGLGIGGGGYNRGVYDYANSRWLAYANSSDRTILQAQDGLYMLTASGNLRIPYIETGAVTVGGTANAVCSADVTFSVTFDSAPVILVTALSTVPGTLTEVTVGSRSTTGFTVCQYRTNTTTNGVMWAAIGYVS